MTYCYTFYLVIILISVATSESSNFSYVNHTHHKHFPCQHEGPGHIHRGAFCIFKPRAHRLICSGGLNSKYQLGSEHVRYLTLCHWPEEEFAADDILELFPNIKRLTLTNSNVSHFSAHFPEVPNVIEVINITRTRLKRLDSSTFWSLRALQVLDLRHNELSTVAPGLLVEAVQLRRVYLQGNHWDCSSDLGWLSQKDRVEAQRVQDKEKMICADKNYRGKPLVRILDYIQTLAAQCPRGIGYNCTCKMLNAVWDPLDGSLVPLTVVNCSNLELLELPETLPEHTTTLDASANRISNLRPLAINPNYRNVADVIVDDNYLSSIATLEGAEWLETFRILSLRGNRLKQVPTYALDNALSKNQNVARIHLGRNPWRCDCVYMPRLQELLLKYQSIIPDMDQITCRYVEDDLNSNAMIKTLSISSVCRAEPEKWLRPLDWLNIFLGLSIILVWLKLAYDYYNFKKCGRLPWIITKLP